MRGKQVQKRTVEPDTLYNSKLVAKFINRFMKDGKKSVAQKVVYGAFHIIEGKGQNPKEVFERAIQNVGPKQEVRARRVGGASYQIPAEVRGDRRISLAIRWIIEAAKKRPNTEFHTIAEKLAAEFMDAIENKGESTKKRDTVHRMAEANKAFSHFRW